MSDQYRTVLHEWAARHTPPDAKVTDVRIDFEKGWSTDSTTEDASLDITIDYTLDGQTNYVWLTDGDENARTISGLLHELFAIEARPEATRD